MCARALLEHGATNLVIFDVDEDQGTAALHHLWLLRVIGNQPDWEVLFKKVDVTDEASVNKAVDEVTGVFRGVDILLCFAGITESKLAVDYPIDSWRRIFDVNVHGSFLVARAVARSFPTCSDCI